MVSVRLRQRLRWTCATRRRPSCRAMDKPTICAVNGGAAGTCVGMDTALGCDIRIMAESSKLAAAFVKRGVVPESGGTWFLPRMIGWAKASELIFTGRTLSAREISRMGPYQRGGAGRRLDGPGA